jgi:hypothetical protein
LVNFTAPFSIQRSGVGVAPDLNLINVRPDELSVSDHRPPFTYMAGKSQKLIGDSFLLN